MDSIRGESVRPDTWHFVVALLFAPGFVVARFLLDRFIYRRLALWLLSKRHPSLKINETTRAKISKCTESMWKLTYFATVEFCILTITYNEPWFTDTKLYFEGWPNQELKFPLMLFYMCQCGFYIYSIAALVTWETRRKDFAVMMSHHVITVILIEYSFITSRSLSLDAGSLVVAALASSTNCIMCSMHFLHTHRIASRRLVKKNSMVHKRLSKRQCAPYWDVMIDPSEPYWPFTASYIFLPASIASWFLNMSRASSLEETTTVHIEPSHRVLMGPFLCDNLDNDTWGIMGA